MCFFLLPTRLCFWMEPRYKLHVSLSLNYTNSICIIGIIKSTAVVVPDCMIAAFFGLLVTSLTSVTLIKVFLKDNRDSRFITNTMQTKDTFVQSHGYTASKGNN